MSADWKAAESLMLENAGKDLVQNITQGRVDVQFPEDDDLSGAAEALLRLQDTYDLDTSELARGIIEGTDLSHELTASDCFELGRQCYNNGNHHHAILWMRESLKRLDKETIKSVDKAEILGYLSFSTYLRGNTSGALKLTNELLKLVPDHTQAQGNRIFYTDAIFKASELKSRNSNENVTVDDDTKYLKATKTEINMEERLEYETLCQSKGTTVFPGHNDLYCDYFTNGNPFYFLQPVKREVVFQEPRIIMFHDIVSDEEMNVIKFLAQPRLHRAEVVNPVTGAPEHAKYRVSKSAWLSDDDHPVISRISKRVEKITGLSISSAETLQVVNYGIGGHYEPHFDFARKGETTWGYNRINGNRIATWILYMSDVAGGATVFPRIQVALHPKKGAAAFWHNLHRNGEGDLLTRHAGCPVLAGSKWISNKWLHERGQEFRRPCGLLESD